MGNIAFHMGNEGAYDGNSRQIVTVFRGKLCKYYQKPFQNMDETGLFAKIPAVRICDPLQVSLLAEALFLVFADGRKETSAMGRKWL